MKLEEKNFRLDSTGWERIISEGEEYLENPEGDIWEILEGDHKGEQLFAWDAAIRETTKAGKRMPTDKEFSFFLETKKDMPNPIFAGYRHAAGSFYDRGTNAYFWSSTRGGADAWYRDMYSTSATVYRHADGRAFGFSVRCIEE